MSQPSSEWSNRLNHPNCILWLLHFIESITGTSAAAESKAFNSKNLSQSQIKKEETTSSGTKCTGTESAAVSMKSEGNIVIELSDEELLQMALMFEKQQQQQQ